MLSRGATLKSARLVALASVQPPANRFVTGAGLERPTQSNHHDHRTTYVSARRPAAALLTIAAGGAVAAAYPSRCAGGHACDRRDILIEAHRRAHVAHTDEKTETGE